MTGVQTCALPIFGTTTVSGSAPLATPCRAVPGFAIAADAIEPTLLPLPSSIAADTLTAGDDCAVAVFVKVNVTTHAVPDAVPPDAAVSTSCPVDCVHAPLVPNRFDVEDTVTLPESAVCDPVSPVMVTVDPVARLKLAVSETVNVFGTPAMISLCWIDFRLKLGTSTVWCRVVSLCQSTARAHARAQCVCVCVCVWKREWERL